MLPLWTDQSYCQFKLVLPTVELRLLLKIWVAFSTTKIILTTEYVVKVVGKWEEETPKAWYKGRDKERMQKRWGIPPVLQSPCMVIGMSLINTAKHIKQSLIQNQLFCFHRGKFLYILLFVPVHAEVTTSVPECHDNGIWDSLKGDGEGAETILIGQSVPPPLLEWHSKRLKLSPPGNM
jgi:hypothetical protein